MSAVTPTINRFLTELGAINDPVGREILTYVKDFKLDDAGEAILKRLNDLITKSKQEFERFKSANSNLPSNFNTLQENLKRMDLLLLKHTFKKAKDEGKNANEVLENFITILNDKVNNVNQLLGQTGGNINQESQVETNEKYYQKYLKYKNKYLNLKKSL